MKRKIDVIIPIYNAYEDLQRCIKSVILNTDSEIYHLVLINDASPDERISAYLETIQQKYSELVVIITNDENLGFVKTCNRGISAACGDVVLLNSDTMVTKGWLTRMLRASESLDQVASVTPMSNNATLVSVPDILCENAVPARLGLEGTARLIEAISESVYPQIPTGMGYCMYMTRRAIDAIGLLDETHFGKGYGEENDWCFRATLSGFIHLMCDDTYIYHKGSASFLGDKEEYVEESEKYLTTEYPFQMNDLSLFLADSSMKKFRDEIRAVFEIFNTSKKGILYIVHNSPLHDGFLIRGGAEYHVSDLIENLPGETIYVLHAVLAHPDRIILAISYDGEYKEYYINVGVRLDSLDLSNKAFEAVLSLILEVLPLKAIHIHHWIRLGLDVFSACEKAGIPYYVTLHDYYSVCPRIQFLNEKNEYCGAGSRDCITCVWQCFGLKEQYVICWREKMRHFLHSAQNVYVPSAYMVKELREWFPDLNFVIREHGMAEYHSENIPALSDGKLRVALVGNMQPSKGSGILISMLSNGLPDWLEIHVFGEILDVRLNDVKMENVIFYGAYKRDTLPGFLESAGIDLVMLPNIWPETYSYTLSEAIQAGCAVLAADIGAIGQRLKAYDCGYLLPIGCMPEDYLNKIIEIHENIDELLIQKQKVRALSLPEKKQVAYQYLDDYNSFETEISIQYDSKRIRELIRRTESREQKNMEKAIANKLGVEETQIKPQYVSNLYVDIGKGFNENNIIKKPVPFSGSFDLLYEFSCSLEVRSLRWDPVEGIPSRVKINNIIVEPDGSPKYNLSIYDLKHNGFTDNDYIQFTTIDPSFILPVEGKILSLEIKGIFEAGMTGLISNTSLFIDTGNGFNEQQKCMCKIVDTPEFKISFNLTGIPGAEYVRWDPIENSPCSVILDNVHAHGADGKNQLKIWSHNGVDKGGILTFPGPDPWIIFKVDQEIDCIEIQGIWLKGKVLDLEPIEFLSEDRYFDQQLTRLYIDNGNGFSEKDVLVQTISNRSIFKLAFDIEDYKDVKAVRWDPVEKSCLLWLNEVSLCYKGRQKIIEKSQWSINGEYVGSSIMFKTNDPWVIIPVDVEVSKIVIQGYWIEKEVV